MNEYNAENLHKIITELQQELAGIKTTVGQLRAESERRQQNSFPSIESLLDDLHVGEWPTTPRNKTPNGWDNIVDPWIDSIPTIGDKIPSSYRIWQSSRRYLLAGDYERAARCERLNYLFHNSYIPAALDLRGEITFAYGGIGVIVHQDSDIFEGVTIGANVTIGGNGGTVRLDERTKKSSTVPRIEAMTTIGACANITGGITLGAMSIIAPNAVVTKSAPAGSILAGVPARIVGHVTAENALRYKAKYLPARSMSNDEYLQKASTFLSSN